MFTTPDFAPRVVKTVPKNGAFNIGAQTPITLTFSEPMDTTTTAAAFSVKVGAKQIPGDISFLNSAAGVNTVMTFAPSSGYGDGVTVSWLLTTVASDASGQKMLANVTGSFSTQPVLAP